VAERLRLLDEGPDQVTVVDLTHRLVASPAIAARQRQYGRDAQVADQPVVVEVHFEAASDQARGNGVEDAAHANGARARYAGGCDREVGGAVARQRGERLELDGDGSRAACILAGDRLGEEGLIGREIGEVVRAAELNRFLDRTLEMAMRCFDRAILVGNAGIVAGRLDAIVATELGVAPGLILTVGEVAVGGRQPVGAVLARAPAELPERFLQTFGQGGEALAALNGANMLPVREGEPEVIEHMPERLAANRHCEAVGMGEV
jgi:hypothetical protein